MHLLSHTVLLTVFLGALAYNVSAKGWKGLVPLHSTREDLITKFNQCLDSASPCDFTSEGAAVHIVFSSRSQSVDECEKSLPADTILLIEVKPLTPLRLSNLKTNLEKFRVFDPGTPAAQSRKVGYKGYIDEASGFVINSLKGKVVQLVYLASADDRTSCSSYYDSPESFVTFGLFYHGTPLSISCPSSKVIAGQVITISTDTVWQAKTKFSWKLTAGRIIRGQGSAKIEVDTEGLDGQLVTATVEARDSNRHVQATSSVIRIISKE